MKWIIQFLILFSFFSQSEEFPRRQVKMKLTGSVKQVGQIVDLKFVTEEFKKTEQINTISPFDSGKHVFEGITLADFVNKFKDGDVKEIIVKATDGYKAHISKNQWEKFHALLAWKMDSHYIDSKGKGTFRIVFNYSDNMQVDNKEFNHKWVWKIHEIEFVK